MRLDGSSGPLARDGASVRDVLVHDGRALT
jgi:hypothetical protein